MRGFVLIALTSIFGCETPFRLAVASSPTVVLDAEHPTVEMTARVCVDKFGSEDYPTHLGIFIEDEWLEEPADTSLTHLGLSVEFGEARYSGWFQQDTGAGMVLWGEPLGPLCDQVVTIKAERLEHTPEGRLAFTLRMELGVYFRNRDPEITLEFDELEIGN